MQVCELTPAFGALITEFNPNTTLEGAAQDLRGLFDRHGALVFRGLSIDHEMQGRICRTLLGDMSASISRPDFNVSNEEPEANGASGRLQFHADSMWHPEPTQVL
jgi:alpha-ketoglutarate-dependent taurine dioxygenase